VEHKFASGGCAGPSSIFLKIGSDKLDAVAGINAAGFQHRSNIGFAREAAYGGANLVALRQQLKNGVTADESGPAGDKNSAHERCALTCAILCPCHNRLRGRIDDDTAAR
jgi:hypothetical protein